VVEPIQAAHTFHQEGYNCAQSVILAFAERYNLDKDLAARLAAGLGGGMGRAARTCGAVTGAIIVLGLQHGSHPPMDKEAKEQAYAIARQFQAEFQARRGALDCRDLLGVDISTPEGLARARAEKLFQGCDGYITTAVQILLEMI
jgi:C_GCAxxG_C_C family probable redox protein